MYVVLQSLRLYKLGAPCMMDIGENLLRAVWDLRMVAELGIA